jgi:hypothetical protein
VGSKAEDDVGMLCQGGKGRDVECTCVHGVYALAIWEMGNNGLVDWMHIGHGGSRCEKMASCTRVKDGPCLSSSHINIDSFEVCSRGKRIFWGRDWATLR